MVRILRQSLVLKPLNFSVVDSKAYYFIPDKMTHSEAISYCQKLGGHLPKPDNLTEQTEQIDKVIGTSAYYWIDAFKMGSSSYWNDGSPISWFPSWLKTSNCQHYRCGVSSRTSDSKWNFLSPIDKQSVVCQLQERDVMKIRSSLIPDFQNTSKSLSLSSVYIDLVKSERTIKDIEAFIYRDMNKVYFVSDERKNYLVARNYCIENGGSLVRIETENEIRYVRNRVVDQDYWIDAVKNVQGSFNWNDGSAISWTSWKAGQPNCSVEDCAIYVELSEGNWVAVDYSAELKKLALCEKQAEDKISALNDTLPDLVNKLIQDGRWLQDGGNANLTSRDDHLKLLRRLDRYESNQRIILVTLCVSIVAIAMIQIFILYVSCRLIKKRDTRPISSVGHFNPGADTCIISNELTTTNEYHVVQ
ncbi:Macrophage mannose receptor 1 [Halotydeus destructor]|nr:Macrophage mannose receptor 1 [Halotydeus destructor]